MADLDGVKESREFHAGVPQRTDGFFLKGSAHHDWGMKNRLARIFDPQSGRTVMLAFGQESGQSGSSPLAAASPMSGFLARKFHTPID